MPILLKQYPTDEEIQSIEVREFMPKKLHEAYHHRTGRLSTVVYDKNRIESAMNNHKELKQKTRRQT